MKRKNLLLLFCLHVFTFLLSYQSQAQSLADIRAQMTKDWDRSKAYSVEYLNTMPADKYSFRATDSIRSFAQQMLHLAQGNVYLMSTAVGQPPPAWLMSNPEKRATAQQKDSVMYYVTASYDYCKNAVQNTDVSKWGEKTKIFGFEETRFALMNKTFEHQGHHRSQTTVYIRLQGIKPPEERLF